MTEKHESNLFKQSREELTVGDVSESSGHVCPCEIQLWSSL